ncbi:MAG: hypothetical protein K2O22_04810 [Anaeroplasmataceae bacterium]|nr:hypothetical protein [Anaeroplasmataceae bacterium]
MAKTGRTGIFGLLAYAAIILNALAWVLKILADYLWDAFRPFANLFVGVASLFLLAVAIYVSYDFAKHQKKCWRILWWVLVIISLVSVFFGIGTNFIK